VALRILAAASQSAASLRDRLRRRGFSDAAAAAATETMVRLRYVDDEALAGALAGRRQRTGHGRIHVGAELRARGIGDEAIASALAAVDPEQERAAALELGRRLARRPANSLDDHRGRQRLGATLHRRGFDTDTVTWVLRQLELEG
jgi:regulatory protein